MELYRKQQSEPVWFSFENPTGAKGAGGQENNGAKGHPSDPIAPGERKLLCDMEGPGVVRRIWMTLNEFGMCNCGKDAFPVQKRLYTGRIPRRPARGLAGAARRDIEGGARGGLRAAGRLSSRGDARLVPVFREPAHVLRKDVHDGRNPAR